MKRAAGVLCVVLALIFVGLFGANLMEIAAHQAPPGELLVRKPNLNWVPLMGAVVTSILGFYLLRKNRATNA